MPKKNKDFFDEMTEQSEVKTEIVRKYFWAWATVMSKQVVKIGRHKIAFVDLFAGPGKYKDGTPSTPILILERAVKDPNIAPLLAAFFNDANRENTLALEEAIKSVPGINTLRYKPIVRNYEVDDDLAARFEIWDTPTLFFLDPWGYVGLSPKLIRATLKPWGCDCIFFFNYNRINAALSNPVFTKNMNAFFGKARADQLRENLEGMEPYYRQELIIDALNHALKEMGAAYSIEYYFKDDSGYKTSHFVIFATKNVLGYNIMKSIMGKQSSMADHGVPTYGFSPRHRELADEREKKPTLFDLERDPIEELAEDLLMIFAGRTITTKEIYQEHHIEKPFLLKNYQDALKRLDAAGRIQTTPPAEKRLRAGRMTFGENVKVTFPKGA